MSLRQENQDTPFAKASLLQDGLNYVGSHPGEVMLSGAALLAAGYALSKGKFSTGETVQKLAPSVSSGTESAAKRAAGSELHAISMTSTSCSASRITGGSLEIPELWAPKRTFASRQELIEEAGFPGLEHMELSDKPTLERLVTGLRKPMSGWTENLEAEGNFRRSSLGMIHHVKMSDGTNLVLDSRVADINNSLAHFAEGEKLAKVPVVRADYEMDGVDGGLSRKTGKMVFADSVLLKATDSQFAHEFIGVAGHEFTHGQQLNLIIRKIAQDLRIGARAGSREYGQVAAKYENLSAIEIAPGFVADTLRGAGPLTSVQMERAERLMTGWGKSNSGDPYLGFHFRTIEDHVERLLDPQTRNWYAQRILEQSKSSGFAEANFGTPQLTGDLARLQRQIVGQGKEYLLPQAADKLAAAMTARLHGINAIRQSEYAVYMQFSEHEGLVAGELARLKSVEMGPISKNH